MELFRRRQFAFKELVADPEDAMHLDPAAFGQGTQCRVTRQQDAAGMSFRQDKGKAIVNAEPRLSKDGLARPRDLGPRQVHNLESRRNQVLLLFGGKAQQFIFEERVGDQNFEGQPQESREQRGLAQIDETACITDDDPHRFRTVPSARPPREAVIFSATQPLY